jgi:hypothetical protein
MRDKDGEHPAGTPYYVGKGKGIRAFTKHSGHIQPPIDKSRIIVMFRDSEQEAYDTEKELINNWGRIDIGTGCLRNLTDGGEGNITRGFLGHKHTEESNRKNSEAHKGRPGPRLGVVVSLETKEKMSVARRGKVPPNKGKKYSPELCVKMGPAQKKRFETETIWNKGKQWSPETRLKMSIAAKKRFEDPKERIRLKELGKRGAAVRWGGA